MVKRCLEYLSSGEKCAGWAEIVGRPSSVRFCNKKYTHVNYIVSNDSLTSYFTFKVYTRSPFSFNVYIKYIFEFFLIDFSAKFNFCL